jgi:hypothetical protein
MSVLEHSQGYVILLNAWGSPPSQKMSSVIQFSAAEV